MNERKLWLPLTAALLSVLAACEEDTGTPCREDYHCYSNSCTWGTCDSRWSVELSEELFGDDDDEQRAEPTVECWKLDPDECTAWTQCQVIDPCEHRPTCEEYERVGLTCRHRDRTCSTFCTTR